MRNAKNSFIANRRNKLRIIGGQWRGRKLEFNDAEGLRPTGDRIRETVFNWLEPYTDGANCLDLFAGSGALGFEAASRGAQSVTMIELNRKTCRQLQSNKQLLQADMITILNTDSLAWLQQNKQQFTVIFIDPPFHHQMAQQAIETLASHHCLAQNAWIYIETASRESNVQVPNNWSIYREKIAGQVRFQLYQTTGN